MSPPPAGTDLPAAPALRVFGRIVSLLSATAMALAAAALLVSLALIGWAVVMRYVFNSAPVWVDEIVGFLLVAIVMLATAQTFRGGGHIGVDLLVGRLTASGIRWAQVWSALSTLAITLVLIFNGSETAMLAHSLGLVTEGNLEWPTWMLMVFMPIGGGLLLLTAIEALWRAIAHLPSIAAQADQDRDDR